MGYYGSDYYTKDISHHGILGQKWGKKNGPPYPLDSEDHSKKEKQEANNAGIKIGKSSGNFEDPKELLRKTRNQMITIDDVKSFKPDDAIKQYDTKVRENYRSKMIEKYKSDPVTRKKYEKMSDDDIDRDIQRKKNVRNALIAGATVAGVAAGVYFAYKYANKSNIEDVLSKSPDKTITKDVLDIARESALKDVEFVLPKNSEIHRVVGFEDFDLSKYDSTGMYTSFTKADRVAYRQLLKDWSGTGKRYDVALELQKDIKVPAKSTVEEVVNNLHKNKKYTTELEKTLIDAYKDLGLTEYSAKSEAKRMMKNPFDASMYAIVRDREDTKMLKEELKKKGYDALLDYFDKGSLAEAPLILFDAQNDLSVKSQEKVVSAALRKGILIDPRSLKELKVIADDDDHPMQTLAKQLTAFRF